MPIVRMIRPALVLAALGLAGCVAPPPGPVGPPGYYGTTCAAGFYTCQVPPGQGGTPCSCPGLGAPSFGVIR